MHRLTRLSLRYPRATLATIGVITLILSLGLLRLRTEYGYRVLIGDDHPSIQTLDGFIARFGGGLPVQIAWQCGEGNPCLSVFDPTALAMAAAVTEALRASPGIQLVQGPANAPILVATEDGFAARQLVENGVVPDDIEQLSELVLRDSLWVDRLVSADGRVGVIVAQATETTSEAHEAVVDLLEMVLAPHEAKGFKFFVVGDPVETVVPGRELAKSTARVIPLTIIVILGIVFLSTGSWSQVALAVGTMLVGLVWTFGFLGWLGWPQDGVLEVLAPLILVVGICDSVHLLSVFGRLFAESPTDGRDRIELLERTTMEVGSPCFMTSLTTALAFLSFVSSPLHTFIRFGLISAFGVMACLVLTFSMVPIGATLLPIRADADMKVSSLWLSSLRAVLSFSESRWRGILATSVAAFVFCLAGWVVYLKVDTDWMESWGEQSVVVQSIRFLESKMQRSMTLEAEITLPPGSLVEDPASLAAIGGLAAFMSAQPALGRATSILDLISGVNRTLHGDDAAYAQVGDTMAANAEVIELLALENFAALSAWLSIDRSSARISVDSPERSYRTSLRTMESIAAYIATELPKDWIVRLSGEFAITVDWIRDVQRTQLRSFPTSLLLVFLTVAAFFKSFRLAAVAMVPALLPVVVTLGLMGWVGMSLDVGRAMIGSIMIGIGVDDAIHMLSHYDKRRKAGDSPHQAISEAVIHTGRAIVTTSLALSLGFLTLLFSAWQTISSFGFFVSISILTALAAVLLVVPAIFFAFAGEE